MLLQFSSRHVLTLHGSRHQSVRYSSKIGRRGKTAFSPTSPLATIAEEDTEAAETAASFDNHEVIETLLMTLMIPSSTLPKMRFLLRQNWKTLFLLPPHEYNGTISII